LSDRSFSFTALNRRCRLSDHLSALINDRGSDYNRSLLQAWTQGPTKSRTDKRLDKRLLTGNLSRMAGQIRTGTICDQNHFPAIQFRANRILNRPLQPAPISQMPQETAEFAALGGDENNHTYPFA
jgi:hypothetical protein